MQLIPSTRALDGDWTGPPGVTSYSADRGAAGEKDLRSAEKAYPLTKSRFVFEC